jgi:HK97 gp10 family phage protein
MSGMTVNLSGLAAIHARMANLSREQQTKLGQSANRAGAVSIAKKVKAAASVSNVLEGAVRNRKTKAGSVRQEVHHKISNSIKVKKTKSNDPSKVVNSIVAGTYTANFEEFGSIHNTPNPFMRTAFDQGQQDAIDAISKLLGKRLVKAGF